MSHNLYDTDLDAPEALAVADVFLLPTPMVCGRKSKPRSHRFYISSATLRSKRFEDPLIKDRKKAMLLELRANSSNGSPQQTVVPPSLHKETGEPISWEGQLEPAPIDPQKLQADLAHAAACALIVRYWRGKVSPHGHELALALSGALLRTGMQLKAVKRIVLTAARIVGYDDVNPAVVDDTDRNLKAGRSVTGWPRVGEILDPKIAKRLREWLGGAEAEAPTIIPPATLTKPELRFPRKSMIGTLGVLAEIMAEGTEVPEEFYFAAGLTVFGNQYATRFRVKAHVEPEPRLYTVLLGESADVKKSTALNRTIEFFRNLWEPAPYFAYGVGSAEGLAEILEENPNTVMCYDELRAFLDKTKVQASVLLSMVTSLYESTIWHNRTKRDAKRLDNAHLSLLSCCTLDTYETMWSTESLAIGFLNRLFVVVADVKPGVSWPPPPDPAKLEGVRRDLIKHMQRLPEEGALLFDITLDARARWDAWYQQMRELRSLHTKRLDSIGFRLMSILTHTTGKTIVDLEIIEAVILILDYEFRVRRLTDPIDAENIIARLEEKVRNLLTTHGGMYEQDLKHACHIRRYGNWYFAKTIDSLRDAGEITKELVTRGNRKTWLYQPADASPPG